MLRADVNEVDIEAVDLGHELRQGIQLRFRLPPVVAGAPILDERLDLRELYALRLVTDRLRIGPARRLHTPAKVNEVLLGDIDAERADGITRGSRRRTRGKQAGGASSGDCHRGCCQELAPVPVDGFRI